MKKKNIVLIFLFILFDIAVITLVYIYGVLKPSNDKNWETGFDILPHITIKNDVVTVEKLRDFHYAPKKFTSFGHITRKIPVKDIEKVYFMVEPFGQYPGIAHTYFVFDIKNQNPVVISVEARREKGETYSAVLGLFNKFELIYVWGEETDETLGRVLMYDDDLYMYPTSLSKLWVQKLFLQLAKDSQSLETKPRFYNSLLNNCTSELARVANSIKPGAIPFDIAYILPAYAPDLLYRLGFIPHDKPFEEIKKQYYITDIVKRIYKKEDFSIKLRESLAE